VPTYLVHGCSTTIFLEKEKYPGIDEGRKGIVRKKLTPLTILFEGSLPGDSYTSRLQVQLHPSDSQVDNTSLLPVQGI
jgi:hypothetical protein